MESGSLPWQVPSAPETRETAALIASRRLWPRQAPTTRSRETLVAGHNCGRTGAHREVAWVAVWGTEDQAARRVLQPCGPWCEEGPMNIVVGYAERPESRAALDEAVRQARAHSARLFVVRTVSDAMTESTARTRSLADQHAQAKQATEKVVAELRDEGIDVELRVETFDQDAATALLHAAKELGADLLVIGIRRRSPVGKLVLGSVSQNVLLGADCPVLAVKAAEG